MLAAVSLPFSSSAQPGVRFDRIIVIGDSLSDIGNAGRFSNGPVWVEHLAAHFGLRLRPSQAGGDDFAVGGARVPAETGPHSLRAQADAVMSGRPPEGRTLAIVFGGGNDLLAATGQPGVTAGIRRAAQSLAGIVRDLSRWGATDLLVPNLPDVGMTPAVRAHGPQAVTLAGFMSQSFNVEADAALGALAGQGRSHLFRLDVRDLAEAVRRDPASRGFSNVSDPCNGLDHCAGYLFWDGVHPTAEAHEKLAEAAIRLVEGQ